MGIDIKATNKVNLEMLEKARENLEKGYDAESFHVFSKCIKNEYYMNEIEDYEGYRESEYYERDGSEVRSGRSGNERMDRRYPTIRTKMNYFKRETEMIKEVERLLDTNDEYDKERILEHLEELFKDLKVMYPNFYETALRKVRKL